MGLKIRSRIDIDIQKKHLLDLLSGGKLVLCSNQRIAGGLINRISIAVRRSPYRIRSKLRSCAASSRP